jgi:hypothetical protein
MVRQRAQSLSIALRRPLAARRYHANFGAVTTNQGR